MINLDPNDQPQDGQPEGADAGETPAVEETPAGETDGGGGEGAPAAA